MLYKQVIIYKPSIYQYQFVYQGVSYYLRIGGAKIKNCVISIHQYLTLS